MRIKEGKYYLGYGWGTDEILEPSMGEFDTYEEALEAAKKEHRSEAKFEKSRGGEDMMNTYVFHIENGYEYMMTQLSGFKMKIEEYEYE